MRVAVGSANPVKVNAVERVVSRLWPDAIVTSAEVSSGVGEMPKSDAEMITGARNRALGAQRLTAADLGVGLEGGVHRGVAGLLLQGWVVAADGNGKEGVGATAQIPLPPLIAERVLNGEELGPVMDELLNDSNVKQKGGAIGALTAGLVPREDAFAIAVAFALSPFIVPEFHHTNGDS
jgi:inosine/xanthosine triphosphatase